MSAKLTAAGLKVIGASAGSGKTHCLTHEVLDAVTAEGAAHVPLEGLVAVTYTRRAHAELESRIRRTLLDRGRTDRAARLPLAAVGTVHAVCYRWLRELALEAGLSPTLSLLLDDGVALHEVLDEAVSGPEVERLNFLARRMELGLDSRKRRVDWKTPIRNVVALARHGRVGASALGDMAERSLAILLSHLPPPAPEGDALTETLRQAIEASLTALDRIDDDTKTTRDAIDLLKKARGALQWGRWSWATWVTWVKLATLGAGKKSQAALEPVRMAANTYEQHPALRADIEELTRLVYAVAARTLDAYAAHKRMRGLVDYVDMIDHMIDVLSVGEVREELTSRLSMCVVDELQDSSPIQLRLFLELHALAGRSSWVGDPKQCIFEYAGADPVLMDSVLRWAGEQGGEARRLKTNYRSRPELVDLCSRIFARAFATHGIDEADVVVAADRVAPPELEKLPVLGLFYLESTRAEGDVAAIANGISRLLGDPAKTPILDPHTGQIRPVLAGDVAVLLATNAETRALADSLSQLGIRATLARTGLFATPEGTALQAGLGYLLDARDGVAVATLEALYGYGGAGPDAWLAARVEAAQAPRRPSELAAVVRLDALRERVTSASPAELVDAVLVAVDLAKLAAQWPNPPQRLANLESLRNFARVYEQRCTDSGDAASIAGLLRFLGGLTTAVYANGEERAADEQYAGSDPNAVTLLTYHRSKGLEWPVVILGSLDRGPRRDAFSVLPEDERETLDPADPLGGRWIRYLVPAFGHRGAPLYDRVAASPVGQRVAERERRERTRLLYVGFTRARDHLVLACRVHKDGRPRTEWLDELVGVDGDKAIELPSADDTKKVTVRGAEGASAKSAVRRWRLSADLEPNAEEDTERKWFSRPSCVERLGYRGSPSKAQDAVLLLPRIEGAQVFMIHAPLTQGGDLDPDRNAIGEAVHAFLAADIEGLTGAERVDRARSCLVAFGAEATYAASDLIGAADAFRSFVEARMPNARWRREVPVEAPVDGGHRRIDGRIDLILEVNGAAREGECDARTPRRVIVDHKSFSGIGEGAWRKKAGELSPQLAAYALAVDATNRPVDEVWLHFAVAGAVWVGRVAKAES